jgi:hypothetical protein
MGHFNGPFGSCRRIGRGILWASAVVGLWLGAGCGVPQYEKLLGELSLKRLAGILADQNLDDEQRAQELRDLGIDDEQLIDLLLSLDD